MRDSVLPIIEAQQADLVENDHAIDDELVFERTPGHVSLHMTSQEQEAVITGDMMHHPIQCAVPDSCSSFCVDPAQAVATRKAFPARYADGPMRILGTHFASPVARQVISSGETWRIKG